MFETSEQFSTFSGLAPLVSFLFMIRPRISKYAMSFFRSDRKAPYAHGDGDWVAYDNERSIRAKVQLAKQYGLGGIMNWALDIDDFKGTFCGQVTPNDDVVIMSQKIIGSISVVKCGEN